MKQKPDLKIFRKDFPIFCKEQNGKPLIYLDTAATAQKPKVVIDAIADFYTNQYGTVHRALYDLSTNATERYEQTRKKTKIFLNAKKDCEIIFTKGSTDGINLVAHSFAEAFIHSGDEIIISEMEHHSNIVPWQLVCQKYGAHLKVIPITNAGELNLEDYARLLNNKTKIVAISHVANSTGTINPVKKIVEMAKQYNAKVLIDGAQAIPHMCVDVQDLCVDFYVFSGHKVYGPNGIGILYGKEELLNQMPPYQGGGDMISEVSFQKTTYNALPLKFEAGTPAIAEVIGLGKALDYVQNIGLKNIEVWEKELSSVAEEGLRKIPGLKILGTSSNKAAISCFTIEGAHPLDIGTLLNLEGIAIRTGHHCAQPTMKRFGVSAACRISIGLYNTLEDVDHFIHALQKTLRSL